MAGTGTLQKIGGFGGFAVDNAPPTGLLPIAPAIVATNQGGQTNANLLTGLVNRITICNSSADSVILPNSFVGLRIVVINAGAAPAAVFPASGEFINALSQNASFTVTNNKVCEFFCPVIGTWYTLLTA
jgi:hypothetical protein